MSHWNSPSTSRCCISAVSWSRAPAPRWSSIRAPRRSTLAHDALLLSDIDAFYGDSHVLHGVSLRLGEGRLLGLLGRNGAGKSTCMNVTVGLRAPQGRRLFRSLTGRENLMVAWRNRQGVSSQAAWTLDRVARTFPRLGE